MDIPQLILEKAEELYNSNRTYNPSMIDICSQNERHILEDVENQGYHVLGTGTSRVCIKLSDSKIMKISRPPTQNYDGIRANRKEYDLYMNSGDIFNDILAPIYCISPHDYCIVMERATELRGHEHELKKDFIDRCEAAGINIYEGDTPLWNVGYIPSKNCDCFIDYAHISV